LGEAHLRLTTTGDVFDEIAELERFDLRNEIGIVHPQLLGNLIRVHEGTVIRTPAAANLLEERSGQAHRYPLLITRASTPYGSALPHVQYQHLHRIVAVAEAVPLRAVGLAGAGRIRRASTQDVPAMLSTRPRETPLLPLIRTGRRLQMRGTPLTR